MPSGIGGDSSGPHGHFAEEQRLLAEFLGQYGSHIFGSARSGGWPTVISIHGSIRLVIDCLTELQHPAQGCAGDDRRSADDRLRRLDSARISNTAVLGNRLWTMPCCARLQALTGSVDADRRRSLKLTGFDVRESPDHRKTLRRCA
ncbi:MAG: hypothetical protein IPJ07_23205 [Acidobacteria bacterium]|nr:hypothetical protein [Acidobacteriota bacterium]